MSSKKAKTHRGANSRLCGDISCLDTHLNSVDQGKKHPNDCKVFGKPEQSNCVVCGVNFYVMTNRGQAAGKTFFKIYHNDSFYGMSRDDASTTGITKKDWAHPTEAKKRKKIL